MQSLYKFLTEQYLTEARKMSESEKMEILICFAHNNAFMKNDAKNMNYVNNNCAIPSDESYPLIQRFNDNKPKYLEMVKPLNEIYSYIENEVESIKKLI